MNAPHHNWTEANQALLAAELARLRHRLRPADDDAVAGEDLDAEVERAASAMPAPSAIDTVAGLFGLSEFERDLLLLCCGVELDARIASACASYPEPGSSRNPTFATALATLPNAHWSALTHARPLRRWRLIEIASGLRLVDSPLCVDERILHYVAGINLMDSRLRPLLVARAPPSLMSDAHESLVGEISTCLSDASGSPFVMHLDGDDDSGQEDIASAAAARLGMNLFVLRDEDLPAPGMELEQWQALWEREAVLLPALLLLRVSDERSTLAVARFANELQAPLIVASNGSVRLQCVSRSYAVNKPDRTEQTQLWRRALGSRADKLNGELDTLAGQFRFSADIIRTIADSAIAGNDDGIEENLWNACRRSGRKRLDDLAERIRPAATWDDLVLPLGQLNTLKQIAAHLRQRMRVYEEWGFAQHGNRGLGVSALFHGESGTGKTLAAEVLANELGLDLYRIDLSSVVSKYIGETEKNLRRMFDSAEDSGSILLFDEADALFGKRSEVKDSHDRYANIEVSYLLQRMESYRGLAILTTNLKSSLDRSFQRRLRFVVNFPFPDADLREAIWKRAFPSQTPLVDIDYRKLAKLNLPGGNIRNIALNAAFVAAGAGAGVGMQHLLQAVQSERAKLERPLAESETRGWL